jgi:general secretion pathway protein E
VLRQDPDIILVGELRDRETVETAFAAALTGHLVLATLHTNDTATAATRLIEMGAPPYLICGALIGVLAQRLVRRLCKECRARNGDSYVAVGCGVCDQIGYRGRVGIFELATMTEAWRELIMRRAPADAFRNTGAYFLADDALVKAKSGATSFAEVESLLMTGRVEVERV